MRSAPASGNVGRFQYTGQIFLAEVGLYHCKARAYHPALGRFLQTDPIGFAGGLNLYAYVGNDPVNATDPSGLSGDEIVVQGTRTGCSPGASCISGSADIRGFLNAFNQTRNDLFRDSFGPGKGGANGAPDDEIGQCESGNPSEALLDSAPPPAATAGRAAASAAATAGSRIATHPLAKAALLGVAAVLSGDSRRQQFDHYRHYGLAADAALFEGGMRRDSFAAPITDPLVSGREAQPYYSLPAIKGTPNSFYLVSIERGSVQVLGPTVVLPRPEFGPDRVGGLNEVVFPNGTPPGTVAGPFSLPECGAD